MFLGSQEAGRYLKVAALEMLAYVQWEQNFDEAGGESNLLIAVVLRFPHYFYESACILRPRSEIECAECNSACTPPGHCIGVTDLTDFSLACLKSWWDLCHPCSSIISPEQHCPPAQSLYLAKGKVLRVSVNGLILSFSFFLLHLFIKLSVWKVAHSPQPSAPGIPWRCSRCKEKCKRAQWKSSYEYMSIFSAPTQAVMRVDIEGENQFCLPGILFGQFYRQMSKDFRGCEGNRIFSPLFTASILHPLLASSHNWWLCWNVTKSGWSQRAGPTPGFGGSLPWPRDSYHRPLCG